MKYYYTFLIAIGLSFVSPVVLWAQKGRYHLKFQVSKKHFADTIAVECVDGRVVVPVTIGGRLYRFMLDTGAAQAVVYAGEQPDGCQPAGTIVSQDAVGRRHSVPLVVLPPMTLGRDLTLTGCQATVHRRPPGARRFDGILGFDLVAKGIALKIDVRGGYVVLSDIKKFFEGEAGFTGRYSVPPGRFTPHVAVEPFRGYVEEALFDTGSSQLYVMNSQSLKRGEAACRSQRAGQIEGRALGSYALGLHGREALSEVTFLSLDSVSWLGFGLCQLHTKTTQGNSHVGAAVLQHGAVTFMPRNRKIRFQPYEQVRSLHINNEQTEKVIAPVGGLPVAAFVWKDGAAYKAGLREGDVLLKADDREIGTYEDYARTRYIIGHVYTFVVRDVRGFLKEVRMEW